MKLELKIEYEKPKPERFSAIFEMINKAHRTIYAIIKPREQIEWQVALKIYSDVQNYCNKKNLTLINGAYYGENLDRRPQILRPISKLRTTVFKTIN